MTTWRYQFSPSANRVLARTQDEAAQRKHTLIEPEHLLLALIQEKSCAACALLESLRVDFSSLEFELREALNTLPAGGPEGMEMSEAIKQVLEFSLESAAVVQRPYLGTEHLLVGLLRENSSRSTAILHQAGVDYTTTLKYLERTLPEIGAGDGAGGGYPVPAPAEPEEKLPLSKLAASISPVFWFLAAATLVAGGAAFLNLLDSGFSVFLFVTLGWIVSLSLHEFGHALLAYYGGDTSVIHKGYLSLNPLRYTHGFLSIVLPLIYLAMGGIGLPGGAVYINHGKIPSKRMRSLVAAGGPLMTGLFTLFLALPFLLGKAQDTLFQYREFWTAWSLLTFIQITSLLFNLLPIPGLDGFGILLPYLPKGLARRIGSFGSLTVLLIFLLFVQPTPISRSFWLLVANLVDWINIDFDMVITGFELYRFW